MDTSNNPHHHKRSNNRMKLRYTLILVGAVMVASRSLANETNETTISEQTPPVVFSRVKPVHSADPVLSNSGHGYAVSPAFLSLRWFKKIQNKDGSFSTKKDPKSLSTGLCVLSFLANGDTPASEEFGNTIEQALKYLLSVQKPDGTFKGTAENPAIEHGIITWAMCETYGMTRIPFIGIASEKAVNVILEAQLPSGLWSSDYSSNGVQDMEASVWQITALRAASSAGVDDKRLGPAMAKTVDALKESITSASDKKTIAPAVLCMQLIGQSNDSVCQQALKDLASMTVNWDKPEVPNPIYHWSFTHQARFYDGGQSWNEWNKSFIPQSVKAQWIITGAIKDRRGRLVDVGYWVSPSKDERYGKIYSTALLCPMFVYRRYLPTFKQAVEEDRLEEDDDDIRIDINI